ncbi:MAG: SGNH/GDSL hydrolase family protein [Planctomycetes bacterium]|nr:SGNH/GDSL hydrolase family protein [Planctomycetota bacterium]
MPRVQEGERLLFIGDSITDCVHEQVAPPLGGGYVQMVSCLFAARHPELRLAFENRGVGGETIRDLERRWERDVLAARPDWLFIMIGVNDVLYAHLPGLRERAVDLAEYRAAYRRLLARTRAATSARIVLMEPTPLEEDPRSPSHDLMRERCAVLRELAVEYGCGLLDTFERLYRMITRFPGQGWMDDVPHPSLKGHAVVCLAVLEHLGW